MRQVLLIAINFVREQRWPILVLLLWVLGLALLGLTTSEAHQGQDLLFVFKQVALYVVAFSVFFGSSAIYNDRRSRRILSILSKDLERSQYLSGLVLGIVIASAVYSFALGLTGSWTLGEAGFGVGHIWFLMLCLVAACGLAGTVALMFSTFLNPFFAAGATAAAMGVPAALSYGFGIPQLAYVIPVYPLAATVLKSSFNMPEPTSWFPILLAVVETLLFLLLSARIFSYVDIAVAVD